MMEDHRPIAEGTLKHHHKCPRCGDVWEHEAEACKTICSASCENCAPRKPEDQS